MPEAIQYKWGDSHLHIKLGDRTEPRIKALYWGEFVVTAGMSSIFFVQAYPFSDNILDMVSAFCGALLFLLASYRFISRMNYREELWIDSEFLTIVSSTPFRKQIRRYEWQYMGLLHYAGKKSKTDHPLKGGCYDYFGFETQEKLIQNIHHEGNIYFNYFGYPVHFAKGVYSWDAEEMVHLIKIFVGNNLRLAPEWSKMAPETWYDYGNEV